jgi:hypothetical protein
LDFSNADFRHERVSRCGGLRLRSMARMVTGGFLVIGMITVLGTEVAAGRRRHQYAARVKERLRRALLCHATARSRLDWDY